MAKAGGRGSLAIMAELYVSTDIEADGPIPGPHSMLSLASAVFTAEGVLVDTFSANLETLPGAAFDPDTEEWWSRRPEAWKACRFDPAPPAEVMRRYVDWLGSLPGTPVFVGYPAAFDFTFVYWYLMKFVGRSPFQQSALDIRSFAMALLRRDFTATVKRTLPRRWRSRHPHTHVALDDAIEQGELFCSMLRESRQGSLPGRGKDGAAGKESE